MLISNQYYVVSVVSCFGAQFLVHEIPPKDLGESVVVFKTNSISDGFSTTNTVKF